MGIHLLRSHFEGQEVEDDIDGGIGLQLGDDGGFGGSADSTTIDADAIGLVALADEQDVLGQVTLDGVEDGLVLLGTDEFVALGIDLALKVVLLGVEVAERLGEVDEGATSVTLVRGGAGLLAVDEDGGLEAVSLLRGESGVLEVLERDNHMLYG